LRNAGANHVEFLPSLFNRNVRLESRDDVDGAPAAASRVLGRSFKRDVGFNVPHINVTPRRGNELEANVVAENPHNRDWASLECGRPSHNRRIAVKLLLEQAVRQHKRVRLAGRRQAAQREPRARDIPEVVGDPGDSRPKRTIGGGDGVVVGHVSDHPIERLPLRPPGSKVVPRHELLVEDRVCGGNPHKSFRLRIGERPQEHGVEHAEDRGVHANAERQDHYNDHGEAGVPTQCPQRIAAVLTHLLEPKRNPHTTRVFLDAQDISEPSECGDSRVFGQHSTFDILAGLALHVVPDVFVQIVERSFVSHHDCLTSAAGRRTPAIA